MIRATFIVLFVLSWGATGAAGDLCTVVIDSQNPRRVDIRFPGKVITVLGHRHPDREDRKGEVDRPGLEQFLWNKFGRPDSLGNPAATRKQLHEYLKVEAKAIEHWRQDRVTLEIALRNHSHQAFAIEMQPETVRYYDRYTPVIYKNLEAAAKPLKISAHELEDLEMMAMSNPFRMRSSNPELFGTSTVISAEPSEIEIREYDDEHCPPHAEEQGSGIAPIKKEAIDKFFKSLGSRGVLNKENMDAFVKAGSKIVQMQRDEERGLKKKTSDRDAVNIAAKAFRMALTREEIRLLAIWFSRDPLLNRGGYTTLSDDEVIANLPRLIDEYNECWGRDALIARNLAQQSQSVMMFIGLNHLAPQAALLKRECLSLTAN